MASLASTATQEEMNSPAFPSFVIATLLECERLKIWTKTPGNTSSTCGYTGPGVGVLMIIFKQFRIFNLTDLHRWFQNINITPIIFADALNEIIGNMYDNTDFCPIANVHKGISGLLVADLVHEKAAMKTDIPKVLRVYPVERECVNLVEGSNIISFVGKAHLIDTFHHATLYIDTPRQKCFIFDSWTNADGTCRPLVAREHSLPDVKRALDIINFGTEDLDTLVGIFTHFFLAPGTISDSFRSCGPPQAVTVNPVYLKELITTVFHQVITASREGRRLSNFGGKLRKKRNKKTRKLNKKSKSNKCKKKYYKK